MKEKLMIERQAFILPPSAFILALQKFPLHAS